MMTAMISGTGLYHPESSISNEELVQAYNAYVDIYNSQNKSEINQGLLETMAYSDAGFIEKASGIQSRYVIEKSGILNPEIMHPVIDERADNALS